MSETFGIATLAARTGLTQGQLRTWEQRFNFPGGERAENGHRRFTDTDVDRVTRVLAARDRGLPLGVAITEIMTADREASRPTVFGTLVDTFGHLRPEQLDRPSTIRLSRAIEDETMSRNEGAVVLGSFQAAHHFEDSADRWNELARTADWCAVVADFHGARTQHFAPVCVDLPPDAPMRREWSIVTIGEQHSAVLSAWEVPGAGGRRQFEVVLSVQPQVALAAARVLTGVMRAGGAVVPTRVERRLAAPPAPPHHNSADRLLARAVGYLSREDPR